MDHLERWKRTMARRAVDRLPRFYLGTAEFSQSLQVHLQSPLDEVKRVLDALGSDGGFMPGPAHNIQLGTPPENVVAMFEAMDEYFGTSN